MTEPTKLFSAALTLAPLKDGDGNDLPTGTRVTIVHLLDDIACVYEVAWPNPALVGGFAFSTGITELENLSIQPESNDTP